MEINKIIVPVDFGEHTEKLVGFASFIGKQLSAEMIFCHVIEPFRMGEMLLVSPSFDDIEKKRKDGAEERMTHLIREGEENGLICHGKVLFGDIVDEIIAHAKNHHVDMVIIGTHGARGLEKILLGSVAERVLKRIHCPCLIMNPYR